MLQEASKIIGNAFSDSFLKRLCMYLHDCVREEVKSSTFRNLNEDKDNKWYFLDGEESLLFAPETPLNIDGTNSEVTNLMLEAEISHKDHYLLYGHMFLIGKNPKKKRAGEFLTPILYSPCKLERKGINICCELTEETLSLNTGALADLLKIDDEDRVEHLMEGLLEIVPELPLTEEGLQAFLTAFKAIVPDVQIKYSFKDQMFADSKESSLLLTDNSALILTKRPTITAGLLHELTQMADKPAGTYRETSLNLIQEEFSSKKSSKTDEEADKKVKKEDFYPITSLELSDSQKKVIEYSKLYPLTAVYGPPGTGKSQTIVNLVSHLVASGKTVLVTSRMDKAVDVVSDWLNNLGAPFLCLRAGRANYQKHLYFQLQDLLSNKVDLDTGFENSLLVKPEDMKALFEKIGEIENKCAKILELEKSWHCALQKLEQYSETNDGESIIKNDLSTQDTDFIKEMTGKLENSLYKTGFFGSLISKYYFGKIAKKLNLTEKTPSDEIIEQIEADLYLKELKSELKNIENSINKIGNIHELLEELRSLRKKQKTLAKDILKNTRRESLKSLIRDRSKRQSLYVHSKALIERKKNLQNRLLHEEDFKPLLEAFPCWAVTTYALSESLPLKPALFDVVIIDEASQCDIASSFPALYRAKTAIIVGDDKQLPHLSFLEKAKEQSFLSTHNIPDRYQLMWRFRTNSLFDVANFYCSNPVLLDEHFRSCPPIINFSNREFYGNRIRIMNKEINTPDCLELVVVKDGKVDPDNTRNMAEVEKVMEKLQEIIIEQNNKPDNKMHSIDDQKKEYLNKITGERGGETAVASPKQQQPPPLREGQGWVKSHPLNANQYEQKPLSIGIISPFRGQVELLKKAISQILTEETVKKFGIEVGTAHTFQGDEKDIILLSFTLASNSYTQSLTFVQKPNLFNVAITRARKRLISFISREIYDLPHGLLRSYLEYVAKFSSDRAKTDTLPPKFKNSFEQEIASKCIEEGLQVIPGFESAGFKVDMVIHNDNSTIAVLCGGFAQDSDKTAENQSSEIWKQSVLERCGWKILRINFREWHYSQNACINRITQALK